MVSRVLDIVFGYGATTLKTDYMTAALLLYLKSL